MVITIKTAHKFKELYCGTEMKVRDIANKFGCSQDTVRRHLKNQGVERYKKNLPYHKYYKNKYMIGLYDMKENLYMVFDNAYLMANFLGKSLSATYIMLSPVHINEKLRFKGQWYRKILIEI